MFVIFIKDMFSYAGLAEVDTVTVALCYSGLTKATPGHVLGNVIRIHFCVESRIYIYTHFDLPEWHVQDIGAH